MTGAADLHVTQARRLLEVAEHPPKYVTGLDPEGPPIPNPIPPGFDTMVVQVDDVKIDRSGPLLAAQTHALLAVAAELAEANRLTTQAARRQTADCGRQHPGPCAWIDDGKNPPTCLQPEGPTP